MPKTFVCDQINTLYSGFLGGTATAGVAGGPTFVRSTEVRGITKVHRFTVEANYPNPLPDLPLRTNGNTTFAANDLIVLAWMDPTERIYFGKVFITNAWGGNISFGKLDTNCDDNTDPIHYKAATAGTVGNFEFDKNMTEQVGADPRGDQTECNHIPAFGAGKIWLTATISAVPTAGGRIVGFVLCVEEGN